MCPRGRPRGQGRPRGLHLCYLAFLFQSKQQVVLNAIRFFLAV